MPTNGLPVRKVLGTKLYFELNLISPYQEAVLVLKYCIAFPRSAKNALVLTYEGSASISIYLGEFECRLAHFDISCPVSLRCANPNDPNVYIIVTSNRHQRRFVVRTFLFMEQKTNLYLDEEVSIQESVMVVNGRGGAAVPLH